MGLGPSTSELRVHVGAGFRSHWEPVWRPPFLIQGQWPHLILLHCYFCCDFQLLVSPVCSLRCPPPVTPPFHCFLAGLKWSLHVSGRGLSLLLSAHQSPAAMALLKVICRGENTGAQLSSLHSPLPGVLLQGQGCPVVGAGRAQALLSPSQVSPACDQSHGLIRGASDTHSRRGCLFPARSACACISLPTGCWHRARNEEAPSEHSVSFGASQVCPSVQEAQPCETRSSLLKDLLHFADRMVYTPSKACMLMGESITGTKSIKLEWSFPEVMTEGLHLRRTAEVT